MSADTAAAVPRPPARTASTPVLTGAEAVVRSLDLLVDPAELEARRSGWAPLPPRYTRGVLAKYSKLVRSAAEGAVTG